MSQFANYKPIISKLRKKKSLLRKTPNLNEVSDELIALGSELKHFPSYSAYCSLAASRIEHSNHASSTSSETEFDHLLVAARKFDQDADINSAISCYRHAMKLCHESLVYSVLNELAQVYERNGRFTEAAIEYSASGNHRSAGVCYIKSCDHLRALNCSEQIDGVKKFLSIKSTAENDKGKSALIKSPSAQSPTTSVVTITPPTDEMSLQERFLLKDDLVTIYLLKLCIMDSPFKLQVTFPVLPVTHGSSHSSSISFKAEELESLNIALESLLQLIKEGRYRRDSNFKLSIYKELNPRLNSLQRTLVQFILEKKRL